MTEVKTDIQLDLDALAPPKVQISYKGKLIDVITPDVQNYAKIIDLSQQVQKLQQNSEDYTQISGVYAKIEEIIKQLIPELKDEKLNFAQLSALFKMLADIGQPTDQAVAKLKEQGINLTESKQSPKALASPEQSAAS